MPIIDRAVNVAADLLKEAIAGKNLLAVVEESAPPAVRKALAPALSDLMTGNYRAAENGFRALLKSGVQSSPWRGHAFAGLADVFEQTGRGARSDILRAHAVGNIAKKPDFSIFNDPLALPKGYRTDGEGTRQEMQLWKHDFLRERLADGFLDFGELPGASRYTNLMPVRLIVDRSADPGFKLAAQTIEQQFGALKSRPAEYAAALTEYTRRLFTPAGPEAASLVQNYHKFREQNADQAFFLGEFLRKGFGVCNQRALFIKAMADDGGFESTLYRGYTMRTRTGWSGRPHDFPTITINGKEKVYDASMGVIGSNFSRFRGRGYRSTSETGLWR